MLADYHIHTTLCRHACGTPEEYVARASSLGLAEIGFSDHCPWPSGYDPRFRMDAGEFATYRDTIASLRKNQASPVIRYGLEADWVPGRMDEVFSAIVDEPLDYLIGAIHYTDGFPFDNPEIQAEWSRKDTADRVWGRYMELMADMVASGKFDIIAHFDLPKKFGFYPSSMESVLSAASAILAKAAEKRVAIEINTAGLRKPVREIYPSCEILKIAFGKGVKITFGSDAHAPSEVGADFGKAAELARRAGYSEHLVFERRTPRAVPIRCPESTP